MAYHTSYQLTYTVLLIWQSLNICSSSNVSFTWRYINYRGHGVPITNRDVLKLESVFSENTTVSEVDVIWSAPECSLTRTTGFVVHLRCHTPGFHPVTLSIAGVGSRTRELKFTSTNNCYDWYLWALVAESENQTAVPSSTNQPESQQTLRVWIIDKLQASEEERANTAAQPSLFSKRLTKQFYLLGQRPRVVFSPGLSSILVNIRARLIGYNENGAYWVFQLDSTSGSASRPEYKITGLSLALYDCFVSDIKVLPPVPKFAKVINSQSKYHMITGQVTQSLALLPDPCQASVAAAIVEGKLYLTQDDFATIDPLPSPYNTSDLMVSAVAIMFDYVAVLDTEGQVFTLHRDSDKFEQFLLPDGFKPTGISSQDWCIESVYNNVDIDMLIMRNTDEIWISNRLQPATQLRLPIDKIAELSQGQEYMIEIHDASIDMHPGRLGVALKLTVGDEKKIVFVIYDIASDKWQLSSFWVDYRTFNLGKVTMYFLGLAKSSFYFRNQQVLFYSYDDDLNYGMKSVYSCNGSQILAPYPNYIRDILVSRLGDISILLNTNQILYGKVKHDEVVLLDSFHTPGALNTIHWFDVHNRLWFITVSSNGTITKLPYPLKDELTSILGPVKSCPYKYFIHNITKTVYRIDMSETKSFWIFLLYKQTKRNSISTSISDPKGVIEFKQSVISEFRSGLAGQNMTVVFAQKRRMNVTGEAIATQDDINRVAILEVRPKKFNLMCDSPNSVVIYMSVGCPMGRRIQIRRSNDQECKPEDIPDFYTIPAGMWADPYTGQKSTRSKTVTYPKELGCPYILRNRIEYRPQLNLYDYEDFVKMVEADYVVWEVNGRTDFTYSHTMEDVGCMTESQTWEELRQKANYSLAEEDLWGPFNYRSCFHVDNEMPYPESLHSLIYPILNETGHNKLHFSLLYEAVYVFTAKVVDPKFSYCNLSTQFAVRIVGIKAPEDLNAIATANYTVFFCILIILITTYIWFHRRTVKRVKSSVNMQEQPLTESSALQSVDVKTKHNT